MKQLTDMVRESIFDIDDETIVNKKGIHINLTVDSDAKHLLNDYKLKDLKDLLYMFIYNGLEIKSYVNEIAGVMSAKKYGLCYAEYFYCKWLIYVKEQDDINIMAKRGKFDFETDEDFSTYNGIDIEQYAIDFTQEFNKRLKNKTLPENIMNLFNK